MMFDDELSRKEREIPMVDKIAINTVSLFFDSILSSLDRTEYTIEKNVNAYFLLNMPGVSTTLLSFYHIVDPLNLEKMLDDLINHGKYQNILEDIVGIYIYMDPITGEIKNQFKCYYALDEEKVDISQTKELLSKIGI